MPILPKLEIKYAQAQVRTINTSKFGISACGAAKLLKLISSSWSEKIKTRGLDRRINWHSENKVNNLYWSNIRDLHMSSWINFSSSRSEKIKTRGLDRRINSHFEHKYLELTIREIKKTPGLDRRIAFGIYFAFPVNVLGTARSSVENENREKPPGQYDQINNKWLPDLCPFWGRGGQEREKIWRETNAAKEWNAAWKGATAFRCLRWSQVNHESIHVWIASGTASSCSAVQLGCIRCGHALPNTWESQDLSGNGWERMQQSLCNPLPPENG